MSEGPAAAGNSSKLASPPPGINCAGIAGRRHDRFRARLRGADVTVRKTHRDAAIEEETGRSIAR
jgi:hypothetical protein